MIGKKLNLISRVFFILLACVLTNQFTYGQKQTELEEKAVTYFCNNVKQIKKGLIDYDIRFKWRTTGKPSRVYKIADCVGDISLIKDSIPNKIELDNLERLIDSEDYQVINITSIPECSFLKKHVFAPFNKRIYTLQVFNAIEYKGEKFVELYLENKNLNTWIISVKFNNDGVPIEHCTSSIIY